MSFRLSRFQNTWNVFQDSCTREQNAWNNSEWWRHFVLASRHFSIQQTKWLLRASRKLRTVSKFYNKLFKCVRQKAKMAANDFSTVALITGCWHKTGAETLLPPLAQILLRETLQQTPQYQQQRRAMLPPRCCCYNVTKIRIFIW